MNCFSDKMGVFCLDDYGFLFELYFQNLVVESDEFDKMEERFYWQSILVQFVLSFEYCFVILFGELNYIYYLLQIEINFFQKLIFLCFN